MISEREVESIAKLADIRIEKEELGEFTVQFNAILEYFDVLDRVEAAGEGRADLVNVFREDKVRPSLPVEDILANAGSTEDTFIKGPRVM
ncbi:MAG TPA: Asp-tRNA(Asn)/Glu-tRNA(Gln) amidotransferase subunit GatC [Methanoculleus sp.]|nr:Asp-tRNA(Asn)/Glu-tRNA(Gln) amidotransferase subunit GatC [Methanoculleus sp.]